MKKGREDLIDIKKFLFTVVNNWYFFILSTVIFLAAAFLINRYSKDVFSVTTTILIEDDLKSVSESPAQILYNKEIFVPAQDMNNQMILLKSFNLTKKTVKDLNFDISYFLKGDIKTVERNYESPFYLILCDKSQSQKIKGFRATLSFVDSTSYNLSSDYIEDKKYFFGEKIFFNNICFTILSDTVKYLLVKPNKKDPSKLDSITKYKYDFSGIGAKNKIPDVEVVINNIDQVARNYQSKLT